METAEVERELDELESRTERLRALYEQYFMGLERMEPSIPRKDVERRIWVLRREQIRNTGLRFKFQMLVQRFNTFQQYWARVSREIENGTYRRDVIRAATRIGEKEALTIVGKKRAKHYAALIEAQRARGDANAKRREGGDAEGIEEVDAVEDGAEATPAAPGWGDITEVMGGEPTVVGPDPTAPRAPPPRQPIVAAPTIPGALPPLLAPPKPGSPARPAPPPLPAQGSGGLRWSGAKPPPAAPSEPTIVDAQPPVRAPSPAETGASAAKRRVAELAASVAARKEQVASSPVRNDALDLDFDGDMTAPTQPKAVQAKPVHEAPKAQQPPRRRSSRSMRAVRPETVAAPAATTPQGPAAPAQAPVAPSAPRDPASEVTQPTAPRIRQAMAPARPPLAQEATQTAAARPRPLQPSGEPATPKDTSAARPDSELSDQRIRQIYSKYVETKRAANESTAGVTYERLAESLRAQASKLRTSHPKKQVDYEVVVKDGKTMLKPILR